jgi:hypothetical protein
VSEQFAKQFRQLVQVGFSGRLDHDIFSFRHIAANRYSKNVLSWQLCKLRVLA